MRKNFSLFLSVIVSLFFLSATSRVFADDATQLQQAEEYLKNNQYEQAEQVYKQIIAENPNSDLAFQAQKNLTFVYISWHRYPQAEASYQQLLANFSGHKDIAQTVHDIAYKYRCANKQDKANQIDQYVVDNWQGSDYAVLGQMDIAKYYVDQGNDPNAEAATTKLFTSYSGNALIARAIHDIAQHYRGTRKYQKANQLYQYVVDNWPKSEHALWAQADLIKSNIDLGDDPNTEAAVKKLLTNFNDNPLISRVVWDTAQYYRQLKKYEKANQLYQHVVKSWPKAEHAVWAQADLIKSYLAQGDDTSAEDAVDKLLANFNDNPLIARAIWDIGQYYRDLKKYEKANRLYKHVVETWPETEHALWAQADLIKSYLALGDDPNAETAVDKLLTNFSWNKYIARAIHDTAWEYRKLGNYGRANELDQYVIDNWPADVQVMWAKMDMAKTDIGLGNDAAVEKTIDILIADFNECPELPTAIFMLGEEYYNKAFVKENEGQQAESKDYFRKTISIWERIIEELPQSAMTPQAYYFAGRCYESIREYEKSIEYYQVVVDTWPDYKYAWSAQFLIARCYDKLASTGQMPMADAAVQIRQSCNKVLTNYPDSMAVTAAGNLLKRWNSEILDKGVNK